MSDWFFKQGGRDRLVNWLGIDSRIDSSLAEVWARIRDRWNAASSFFARFRLTGWRRLLNEAASETVSLAAGGLIVVYAAALPAFVDFDESRFLTGQFSVTMLDKAGNEIGKRGILHDDAVPLEEIPDHVIKATLATEDRRFFEHFGIDILGTTRALVENLRANDVVQGGSTLTQQLAKNLFLSSERSLQRKVKELFLAFLLESRYTKREILKLYLDRAYMGGGAFGVEAAAQFYFGKSIRDVNLAEAALLAGLYKAPTKYAPHINLPASRARTNEVLSNLVEAGFYSAGQVHAARMNPARIVETRAPYSPDWFLDWAFEEVQRVAQGKGQFVLTARTTIDTGLQKAAEEALVSTIRDAGRRVGARTGALVSMDPDGAVRAIVGGTDYGESQFNRATAAKRQPGSSFKLYVYAAALENGYNPRSRVRDSSRSCGNWHPSNYSGGGGSGRVLSLGEAFAKSLNTTAAELSFAVGREKVIELAQRIGVPGVKKTCSMALGDGGVTPLEHTGAYATFANGGKLAKPYAILELVSSQGELVYSRERDEPPAPQVVERRVAEQMNQMMQMVVEEGTGRRAALEFTHAAGKTGTSSSYRDAWFMGFTGQLVTGVWIGNDEFRPMNNITGGSLPAQIWNSFMSVAHTNMNIPPIPGLSAHPTQVAELQRLAELKRADPTLAQAQTAAAEASKKSPSLVADPTREALKRIGSSLRKAAGLAVEPGESGEPARQAPQRPAEPPTPKGAADRKAEGPSPAGLSPAAAPGAPATADRLATRAPSIRPRDAN
ncbi:MAG: PBP1A family penicillin-binding protein [Pseudomonadota bacterium]